MRSGSTFIFKELLWQPIFVCGKSCKMCCWLNWLTLECTTVSMQITTWIFPSSNVASLSEVTGTPSFVCLYSSIFTMPVTWALLSTLRSSEWVKFWYHCTLWLSSSNSCRVTMPMLKNTLPAKSSDTIECSAFCCWLQKAFNLGFPALGVDLQTAHAVSEIWRALLCLEAIKSCWRVKLQHCFQEVSQQAHTENGRHH